MDFVYKAIAEGHSLHDVRRFVMFATAFKKSAVKSFDVDLLIVPTI